MRVFICFLLVVFCILAACNNRGGNNVSPMSGNDSVGEGYRLKTGWEAEPLLTKADSLQIIYYDDPDGDSLRYTRFYRYLSLSDTGFVRQAVRQFNQPFQQLDGSKPCRSEGKIYFYQKEEPVKTVYFSTRCDSCCYLYFIKDGAFLYFPLAAEFKSTLIGKKGEAHKP